MPRTGSHPPSLAVAWGVLALLAAASSAAPARAMCGDYVHVRTGGEPARPTAPPADGPCHGPNCSQRDGTPPLAPVTPPAPPGPTDAILAADPTPEPGPVGRVREPAAHLPVGPVADAFHPPRAG
jgi:hypothetical protein